MSDALERERPGLEGIQVETLAQIEERLGTALLGRIDDYERKEHDTRQALLIALHDPRAEQVFDSPDVVVNPLESGLVRALEGIAKKIQAFLDRPENEQYGPMAMAIVIGMGGSGKTTLSETLQSLMGTYLQQGNQQETMNHRLFRMQLQEDQAAGTDFPQSVINFDATKIPKELRDQLIKLSDVIRIVEKLRETVASDDPEHPSPLEAKLRNYINSLMLNFEDPYSNPAKEAIITALKATSYFDLAIPTDTGNTDLSTLLAAVETFLTENPTEKFQFQLHLATNLVQKLRESTKDTETTHLDWLSWNDAAGERNSIAKREKGIEIFSGKFRLNFESANNTWTFKDKSGNQVQFEGGSAPFELEFGSTHISVLSSDSDEVSWVAEDTLHVCTRQANGNWEYVARVHPTDHSSDGQADLLPSVRFQLREDETPLRSLKPLDGLLWMEGILAAPQELVGLDITQVTILWVHYVNRMNRILLRNEGRLGADENLDEESIWAANFSRLKNRLQEEDEIARQMRYALLNGAVLISNESVLELMFALACEGRGVPSEFAHLEKYMDELQEAWKHAHARMLGRGSYLESDPMGNGLVSRRNKYRIQRADQVPNEFRQLIENHRLGGLIPATSLIDLPQTHEVANGLSVAYPRSQVVKEALGDQTEVMLQRTSTPFAEFAGEELVFPFEDGYLKRTKAMQDRIHEAFGILKKLFSRGVSPDFSRFDFMNDFCLTVNEAGPTIAYNAMDLTEISQADLRSTELQIACPEAIAHAGLQDFFAEEVAKLNASLATIEIDQQTYVTPPVTDVLIRREMIRETKDHYVMDQARELREMVGEGDAMAWLYTITRTLYPMGTPEKGILMELLKHSFDRSELPNQLCDPALTGDMLNRAAENAQIQISAQGKARLAEVLCLYEKARPMDADQAA